MTPQQISNIVNEKAQARLHDVVERAFIQLRNRHTHNKNRQECICDYCRFIRNEYTLTKIYLHRLNKKLRDFDHDYYYGNRPYRNLYEQHRNCEQKVKDLKKEKQDLKNEII